MRLQKVDLVFHQGDQRRNYQRQPVVAQGGQLITQRLARARWENGQRRPVFVQGVNHRFLSGPELGKAKMRL